MHYDASSHKCIMMLQSDHYPIPSICLAYIFVSHSDASVWFYFNQITCPHLCVHVDVSLHVKIDQISCYNAIGYRIELESVY